MTYRPCKAHSDGTGGGRHGRTLLIADLKSLAPALLRECLRDFLASMASVADAAGALLKYLDPAVVGELQANAPGASWLSDQELAPWVKAYNHRAD